MDLLDSILGSMEKPPTVKKPEIKDKDKREKFEKIQKQRQEAARKQKAMVEKFREDITKQIRDFVNSPTTDNLETRELRLMPMNKLYRSMVREACDDYEEEIVVHSFGTEELDRHCIIWKKGCEPTEDEIRAMKLGVEYKPKTGIEEEKEEEEEEASSQSAAQSKDKYWQKYEKVIGEDAYGLKSARVALPAKQYGCVPIDNKKDQRSIEQMMDDIRRSKRQKTTLDERGSTNLEKPETSTATLASSDVKQSLSTSEEVAYPHESSDSEQD